jgi:integrase
VDKSRGSVNRHRGVWTARVQFIDPLSGERKDIRRTAATKAEACDLRDQILRTMKSTGGDQFAAKEKKTFAELADHYEQTYAIPPEYVDKRRVAGMRAWRTIRGLVKILRAEFCVRQIRSIGYGDVVALKRNLLKSPTVAGKQRSIAYVNRVLSTLRRVLNIAQREGWIDRNPFGSGDSLISVADERKRTRILSRDEEARLLAACDKPRRQHLGPIIICALDTGMRFGEIIQMRWGDVDMGSGIITIEAMHTKTMTERKVAVTSRLRAELVKLRQFFAPVDEDRVFGVSTTVKHSFDAARREAGLVDFRFHDLRHTAATRLTQGRMQLAEVGRILGHSDPKTTFRYVNSDSRTLERGKEILDTFNGMNHPPLPITRKRLRWLAAQSFRRQEGSD